LAGKIAAITLFLAAIMILGTGFTVANADGGSSISPSPLEPKDQAGNTLSSVSSGQMVILSTDVVNNNEEPKAFTAIIEVRDAKGVTLFLGWQSGTLNPIGHTEVGLSWAPKEAGTYELRTFTISGFQDLEILSPVITNKLDVS
jgi:hypothetical protein